MPSIYELITRHEAYAQLALTAAYLVVAWRIRLREGRGDGVKVESPRPTLCEVAMWVLATNARTVRATILILALTLLTAAADPGVIAAVLEHIS